MINRQIYELGDLHKNYPQPKSFSTRPAIGRVEKDLGVLVDEPFFPNRRLVGEGQG